ncbi:serine/arginine repetitive matrix protein 2 [Embleya sp. AB8]|uniref:serine/arginine repetitive matrix protein 2 n=1 Tax=Embleya sp. AB8 TaxID=3156304 RepID=UPI003C792AC7
MADFAIDYNNLYTIQSKLRDLARQADSGSAGAFRELGEASAGERKACLGSATLSLAFNSFHHHSKSRTAKAKEGLNKLADSFKSVSDVFFDSDAQISGAAGLLTSGLGLDQWRNTKATHDKWQADKDRWDAYLAGIGATDYFRDHPDESIRHTCHGPDAPAWCAAWLVKGEDSAPAKPGDEPPKPSDKPPTSYHQQDEHGTVDVNVELDKDNNIVKETSKITDPQGHTYETTTTYNGPPQWVEPPPGGDGKAKPYDVRGYTITTKYGDGTTSSSVFSINHDGSGTMVSTGGDKTEHYIRDGPTGKWKLDPAYTKHKSGADRDTGVGHSGSHLI